MISTSFLSRWLLVLFFAVAGFLHFLHPDVYISIIPPAIPWPAAMNIISGACEILGALGLILPTTRYWAGWGLIALLIAVFPANIYMIVDHVQPLSWKIPDWLLWGRLPLQLALIAWVWSVALRKAPAR